MSPERTWKLNILDKATSSSINQVSASLYYIKHKRNAYETFSLRLKNKRFIRCNITKLSISIELQNHNNEHEN
jgi:hypothetical protein